MAALGSFSLMSGASLESVTERMVAEGMDRAVVTETCQELLASPAYAAGDWMSQRLKKLESTLDVLWVLRAGGGPRSIDQRTGVSRDDFLREYDAVNTPVLLADVAGGVAGTKELEPRLLRRRHGRRDSRDHGQPGR
jgi:hypothetical protein